MPAVSRSSAAAVFELKSAALTLIAVVVRTADLEALADALHDRLGDAPDMFEHDPVVIDITPLRDADTSIDFAALAALLRAHRMLPVAVKGGSAAQMAAALAAGFAEAPEGVAPARPAPAPEIAAAAPSTTAGAADTAATAATADQPDAGHETGPAHQAASAAQDAAAFAAASAADAAVTVAASTVVVDRPLRSGQQVYARNADLVVMAVVSFGAEVIADGHIHVYAPLRGRAIAGAKGNTDARIFSTCMEPQLVSIAGTYRTIEAALPADVAGRPAQVRLDGERLVIEPLAG